jgi:uncharacterized protein (TIGR02145 family)
MKKLIFTLTAIISCAILFMPQQASAQTPQAFKYQTVVRDGNGQVLADQNVNFRISIQQSASFTDVYVETHDALTNAFGIAVLNIGDGTPESGDFTTIDWGADESHIQVEVDINGGTDYIVMGTSQLLAVPYAMHAKTAENVFSGDYYDLENAPDMSNYDTDVTDDFDGNYNSLSNIPDMTGWDQNASDDFSGQYSNLTGAPTNVSAFTNDAGYLTSENDGDAGNELQDLTFSGTELSIENGNTVDLASLQDGTGTDDQTLDEILSADPSAGYNQIKNLDDPTDNRDAVTKMYVDNLIELLNSAVQGVTDIDGNHYNAVVIGEQVWMASNLKVTHYPNGDSIPFISDNGTWGALGDDNYDDAMCYPNNNANNEIDTYGALYTHAAAVGNFWASDNVDDQGVCPDGWHIPTQTDWDELNTYLSSSVGSKMAGRANLWDDGLLVQDANFGSSYFNAVPSGYRNSVNGVMYDEGASTAFWVGKTTYNDYGYMRFIDANDTILDDTYSYKSTGNAVRCIKN